MPGLSVGQAALLGVKRVTKGQTTSDTANSGIPIYTGKWTETSVSSKINFKKLDFIINNTTPDSDINDSAPKTDALNWYLGYREKAALQDRSSGVVQSSAAEQSVSIQKKGGASQETAPVTSLTRGLGISINKGSVSARKLLFSG